MSTLPTVCVMLSAYNGMRFIEEQIDSILSQRQVNVILIVRDDGSSDGTVSLLHRYGDRIRVNQGKNLGVGESFMSMIWNNDIIADYYAFSDQDDVWLPDKLAAAAASLSGYGTPALYCSNQMLSDGAGNRTGVRYSAPPEISWLQILCENRVSGCTMVWNRALQHLMQEEQRRASGALLKKRIHDVWVAAVTALAGTIIYDEKPYILYRQHGDNVVGAKKENRLKLWRKKLRDPALRNGRSDLARELLRGYEDRIEDPETLDILHAFADYRVNSGARRKLRSMREVASRSGGSYLSYRVKILFRLV